MVEQRELEITFAPGFGEAASGGFGVQFALVFVVDDEVAETDELYGCNAFVSAVVEVFHTGVHLLGEHLQDPLQLHGAGEAEEGEVLGGAGRDLADGGSHKQRGVLDDTFAHQGALASFREFTVESALAAADTQLVDEASHDAAEQGIVGGLGCFFRGGWGCSFGGNEPLLPGYVQELLKGLLYLAGGLSMDAIPAAGLDTKVVVLGELVGPHQGVEVGLGAGFKQFAGFGDVFVVAAEAHEEVASADKSGAQCCGRHALMLGGFHEHARIARVHGQAEHLPADGSEFFGSFVDGAQEMQQRFGALDGRGVGLVQPIKARGFFDVQRMEQEYHLSEITALDFRGVFFGTIQMAAFGPEPVTGAWRGAAGAAFALIGTSTADGLEEKCPDASVGVVTGDAGLAAVNDVADAVDGHGGFGDVGGDDDFAERVGLESAILVFGRKVAVERDEGEAFGGASCAQGVDGGVDFAHTRHEHEDVTRLAAIHDLFDGVGSLIGGGAFVDLVEVADFDRITLAFRDQDGAVVQVSCDGFGFQGRGHDGQLKVRAGRLLEILHQRQGNIAEQVALVEFIEEDDADVAERAVILQPTEEDAFGDKTDAGAEAGLIIEADLVSDFLSKRGVAFPSDTGGHGAGGDAAWLEHHDFFGACETGVQDHLGDLGGFARAGGGDEDQSIILLQSLEDGAVNLPDGELGLRHEK